MGVNRNTLSKFLSLVLRHSPETISLNIDKNGWCDVNELISKMNEHGQFITKPILEEIVSNDNKQRYAFSDDCTKIRANQGHSIIVDLELKSEIPPEILYHGTVEQYLNSILQSGIKKGSRQYVHLSQDIKTAENVGMRRGKPIILEVQAKSMYHDGYHFYKSKNNVWLCDYVPKEYIELNKGSI